MWLGIIFLAAVAFEALLMFGQDKLFSNKQRIDMEAELEKTYGDLREAKQRIEDRRAQLMTLIDDHDKQRAQIQEADKQFTESQKALPSLVHVIGLPHSGHRFRAKVTKDLPPTPDKSQRVVWACNNFLEIWADDVEDAKAKAAKQFAGKQGYTVGDVTAIDDQPTPSQPQATPRPALEAVG